jgi:NAD(P)-dependent dehydrogenase (short-subunit alcohol dehydrogenase family)
MTIDLRGHVVVITGASSGLGREAAVQFATAGCKVVVAARRGEDLEETARMCRAAGGEALPVVTDVTRQDEIERLLAATIEAWGRIDVWVNNAGVTLFALLAEAPFEDHRRVIETNLFGAMHAARAVVPIFRSQKRGVLINVGSVLSEVGQAFVPSYAISKFAVRGLSEALRVELADEPDIHVCSLLPYAIDTPHFQSGGNVRGRHARAMPPVQSPEKVARAMVRLAARPRRELHVPRAAVLGLAAHWAFPKTTERLLLHALRTWHFDGARQEATDGGLYRPVEIGEAAVHGVRPPQLSTPRFAAWTARELVRIGLDAGQRRIGSWSSRLRALSARAPEPSWRGGRTSSNIAV